MISANNYEGLVLKNNEDSYIKQVIADHTLDEDLTVYIEDARMKGAGNITGRSSYVDGISALSREITQTQTRNAVNKANDKYSGGKK